MFLSSFGQNAYVKIAKNYMLSRYNCNQITKKLDVTEKTKSSFEISARKLAKNG